MLLGPFLAYCWTLRARSGTFLHTMHSSHSKRPTIVAPFAALVGSTALALLIAALVGARLWSAKPTPVYLVLALILLFAAWSVFVVFLLRRYVLGPLQEGHEANLALRRADKLAATGRFAAGVAHEVGNPLSAIANYAHVVRQRAHAVSGVQEPLDAIEREVERIDRIVRGLLDYARPRRNTPRSVRVDEVIQHVVQLLADQGVLRRVEVQHTLDDAGAEVFAERHDLEQVFVNLLLNAVDAMNGAGTISIRSRRLPAAVMQAVEERRRMDDEPGERFVHEPNLRARVWISARQDASAVLQVVVADSGPGVQPADRDRVFEPFFSTKPASRGTGLGLAIVAQTIDGLGGTVWTQKAREGGAAFVILLPVQLTQESAA